MSLTGSMVVNVTTCGRYVAPMRSWIALQVIRFTAFMAGYSLVFNLNDEPILKAFERSKIRVEIKEGLSIIEVSREL